jgi:hypothetical protein
MSWLLLTGVVLLAGAILIVPGGALGYALGVRGWASFLTAPALSVTLISGLAIVDAAIGVRWSLGSFLAGVALIVVAGFGLTYALGRRFGAPRLHLENLRWRTLGAGFVLWGALTGYTMVKLFAKPDLVIQAYDNVFHLNAIQYALDTGSASTFTIGSLTTGGLPSGPYPAAWHGYVSLVLGTARVLDPTASIAAAVNAATLAVILLAWAAGCLLLTQALAGGRLGVTVITVAAAAPLFAFPWAFLPEGGLYPNLLGNSLLPGAITLLFLLTGRRRPLPFAPAENPLRLVGTHAGWLGAVVALAMLPGITLAHPNSAFSLAAIAIAIAWGAWARPSEDRPPAVRWWGLAAVAAASIGFLAAWVEFAPPRPTPPRPPTDLLDSVWLLIQGAVSTAGLPAPALTVMALLGVGLAVVKRGVAALVSGAFAAVVFVLALGGPSAQASVLAGGLFYNDTKRIAGFVVISALPLIIAGASLIGSALDALPPACPAPRRPGDGFAASAWSSWRAPSRCPCSCGR